VLCMGMASQPYLMGVLGEQVLWGHLYGVLLLSEHETVFAAGGSALIATGVLSLSLRPSSTQEAAAAHDAGAAQPPSAAQAAAGGAAGTAAAGAAATADTEGAPGLVEPRAELRPQAQWALVRWSRRLCGWAGGRAGPTARPRDQGEAEGLVARAAEAPAAWQGAEWPRGRGPLEGQWAGVAEGESARHTVLLVPPDR